MSDPPLFATTEDGARIAIDEVTREGHRAQAVILTHGTFSDARVCLRLARAVGQLGFPTYVMEWRGHGRSSLGRLAPSFETVARQDVPAAIAFVRDRAKRTRLLWVGHSGGGLVPWMHLARTPADVASFDGIVGIATQAFGAGRRFRGRAGVILAALVTNVLRRAPGRALRLGPQDETASMMNEWYRWNLTGRWRAPDGFDYAAAAARIDVPALLFAGAGDRFIAPREGCDALRRCLRRAELVVCGRETGFSDDYDHPRLIASRGAIREVWPLVTRFLAARATDRDAEALHFEERARPPGSA